MGRVWRESLNDDVVDWIGAGYTVEEQVEMCAQRRNREVEWEGLTICEGAYS